MHVTARPPHTRAQATPHTDHCQHTRFLSAKTNMAHLNLTYADLADVLERYPLKARSTTSTNNATPAYIKTIISGVKTANRRTTGHQMTDVGDLLWLNLDNVEGQNLSAKDRPLFVSMVENRSRTTVASRRRRGVVGRTSASNLESC